ncbi:MAG: transcriptional repressor LexA [Treponema sp.]|jgi:repressor LexA|nr:transcriptional repressor LexA [Treponema sp.]
MKELTARQKEVLSFIAEYIGAHSYPPTIREVAEYFSISVKGAHDHVIALKKKGVLKQTDKRSRTMGLVKKEDEGGQAGFTEIPVLGTVAAGQPILSEENWDGTIKLHQSMLKKNKTYFALKVRGDSMSGAGIMDGDTAVIEKQHTVRNGEIAVAVVDDAVTLKRFFRESTRIRLQAENPAYKPMYYSQNIRILGRLAQIVRFY